MDEKNYDQINGALEDNTVSQVISPSINIDEATEPKERQKKNRKEKKFVSRSVFAIGIIFTILFSSIFSVGGVYLLTDVFNAGGNTINNDNYSLAEATGSELSVQEIVAMNENAVVEISTSTVEQTFYSQNIVEGAGSGVIISSDGYIITNNHVIDGATEVTVKLKDGNEYPATLVGRDALTDLAVIKIEKDDLPYATFGDSTALSVGDLAVAIGNPLGELGGTSTVGTISALDRQVTIDGIQMTLLQTDAAINPGNSGGGLFNQHGQLIGIVVAKSVGTDIEGLGFAIPSAQASIIVEDLIENGQVTNRPSIGISIVDLTSAQDAMQYGYKLTGVYISEVLSDTAADAGLQVGDLIYYIEDTQVNSSATLLAAIQSYEVGDTVNLTVIRENKTISIDVELTSLEQ